MPSPFDSLSPELRDRLIRCIESTRDRDDDHLDFLAHATAEPDRLAQIEVTERALTLSTQVLGLLAE